MNFTPYTVVIDVITRQGLDALAVFDYSGTNKIHYVEGATAELARAITDLHGELMDPFKVEAWKSEERPKGGRPSAKTMPFTWVVKPRAMADKPVPPPAAQVVNGHGDEQAIAILKEALNEQREANRELSAKLEAVLEEDDDADDGPDPMEAAKIQLMERGIGALERVITGLFTKGQVNGAHAAARPAPVNGGLPFDRATLHALAKFAQANPEQFAALKDQLMNNYGGPDAPPQADPDEDA